MLLQRYQATTSRLCIDAFARRTFTSLTLAVYIIDRTLGHADVRQANSFAPVVKHGRKNAAAFHTMKTLQSSICMTT